MAESLIPRRRKDGQQSEPTSLTVIVNGLLSSQISKRQTDDTLKGASPLAMSLMKNYLPSQVAKAYNPTLQAGVMAAFPTILSAYHTKNIPAIVHLAQAYDEDVAVKWIQDQLLQVNEFAGVKAKLSDMQLDELAIQIRLEYGYLNLLEFILFCARLRSGRYEDFYGSVDPMRILKSLDSFCADRKIEINREAEVREKEEREKAYEESRKNSISFEDWYRTLPKNKMEEVRNSPYFGGRAREIDKENKHNH